MSLSQKSLSIFNREIFFIVLRIGTGAIVARMLGPTGLGIWMAFDLLTNYCRVFCGPRFEITSVHFLGQRKYARNVVISVVNLVSLLLGLMVMFLIMAGHLFISGIFFKGTEISKFLIYVVAMNIPLMFLKRNYLYFLLSNEDARSYNLMMLIDSLAKVFITVLLLVVFKLGLWGMAIGLTVGSIASLSYGILRYHSGERFVVEFKKSIFISIFKFSIKVYFSEAVGFLTMYLSNMIIAITMQPSMLAFFSMGKGKAELTNTITNSIGTIFYPKIANLKGLGEDTRSVTTFVFRISLLIMICVSLLLSILIYPVVLLLYGNAFVPLIFAFYIILPSMALYNASNLQRQYFLGIGRADIPLKISIIPLALQVMLCYLLMPPLGFVGASIAVSLTFFVTSIVTIVIYHRMAHIKYSELLKIRASDITFVYDFIKERVLFYWANFIMRFLSLKALLQPR